MRWYLLKKKKKWGFYGSVNWRNDEESFPCCSWNLNKFQSCLPFHLEKTESNSLPGRRTDRLLHKKANLRFDQLGSRRRTAEGNTWGVPVKVKRIYSSYSRRAFKKNSDILLWEMAAHLVDFIVNSTETPRARENPLPPPPPPPARRNKTRRVFDFEK